MVTVYLYNAIPKENFSTLAAPANMVQRYQVHLQDNGIIPLPETDEIPHWSFFG